MPATRTAILTLGKREREINLFWWISITLLHNKNGNTFMSVCVCVSCWVWEWCDSSFSVPSCHHSPVNQLVNYCLYPQCENLCQNLWPLGCSPPIPVYRTVDREMLLSQKINLLITWQATMSFISTLPYLLRPPTCENRWEYLMQAQRHVSKVKR